MILINVHHNNPEINVSRSRDSSLAVWFPVHGKNVQKNKSNQEPTLVAKSSFGVEHGGQGAGLTKGQ